MKPVLITGATGFIGRYLVERLLAQGAPVRVLVHHREGISPRLRGKVQVIAGDIRDDDALARGTEGVGTVFHLAALARAWPDDPEAFEAVNVTAVARLLDRAACAGVERFVHTSTVVALPPHLPAPGNGNAPPDTPYEASKKRGDERVRAYVAAGNHAVIVRPTRVYGPGPLTDANGVTRMVSLYLRGRFRVRLADQDVLANYVHVADVAEGMIRAARGPSGGDYLLGGDNVSLREFLDLVSRLGGVHRRTCALSPRVGYALAGLAETWGRLGGTPPLTRG
jgi:nucleoside-diphosphate-sugar epimerase